MLHLGLSWGPGHTDRTPSTLPGACPSPLLTLTPSSLPGLGPLKHSFGKSSLGIRAMALPEADVGLCRKPRGKAGCGQGVRPLFLETQVNLTLSPPPRLSLSLNFNMSRTSRSMASHKLFASSFLLSWDWGGHCQRASRGVL